MRWHKMTKNITKVEMVKNKHKMTWPIMTTSKIIYLKMAKTQIKTLSQTTTYKRIENKQINVNISCKNI